MTFNKKAELHCHSNDLDIRNLYAPFLTDSVQIVKDIVDKCVREDIKILSITDHDTLNGYHVAKEYIHKNKIDILLIPGSEITTSEGHMLAYNIHKEIPPKLSAKETIDLIHKQNGLAVIAHPFMIQSTNTRVFRLKPDAIEGLNAAIPMSANYQAINAANQMKLPYIASSDAHNISATGDGLTIFPDTVVTTSDFAKCLRSGNFSIQFRHSSYRKMLTEHFNALISDIVSGKIFLPISKGAKDILEKERG